MPKFGYFGPNNIDFLILKNFHIYPILSVLIWNLSFVFGINKWHRDNIFTNNNDIFVAHVWIGRYCTVKEFRIDSRNVWINAMKLIWELQLFRVNNLSVHFYIFFFFFFFAVVVVFQLTNVFINGTIFCTPIYPFNI